MNQLETFLLSFGLLMDPSLSFPGFAAVVLNNFHIDNRRERKGEREIGLRFQILRAIL